MGKGGNVHRGGELLPISNPSTKRCSCNCTNDQGSSLNLKHYITIAFFTILATATGWTIIGRIDSDFPILFFSGLEQWQVSLIMFGILAMIFFGFLIIAWLLIHTLEKNTKVELKPPS